MRGGVTAIENLPFDNLPSKYVIKSNHWSGDALICGKSSPVSRDQIQRIAMRLKSGYDDYTKSEWPYRHIAPRVFVEEYLESRFDQLVDYKIFCFNGDPRFIMVCMDRFTDHKRSFFDPNWKPLPFYDWKYPPIELDLQSLKPESLDEMLQHASKLSEDASFLRADFYDVDGECRFGELTLYPECGIDCRFQPDEWNQTIGGWLQLPAPSRNPKFAFGPGIMHF